MCDQRAGVSAAHRLQQKSAVIWWHRTYIEAQHQHDMNKYQPTDTALVKPQTEGAIALNLATGEYYSMNEASARMWSLLADGCSEKEIVDDIVSRYSASPEEVKRDLARLIRDLLEKGLLVEV